MTSVSKKFEPTDFTKNNPSTDIKPLQGRTTSKPYTRANHWHRQNDRYECSDTGLSKWINGQTFQCLNCTNSICWYRYPQADGLPEWFKNPGRESK